MPAKTSLASIPLGIAARTLLLVLGVICGGLSTRLYASDFQSARTAGIGGAGHAGPLFTDAIYLNPSYLSLLSGFALSSDYVLYNGSSNSVPNGMAYQVAAIASYPVLPVQFGIGYSRFDNGQLIHGALSREIFNRLTIGLGVKFLSTNSFWNGNTLGDGSGSLTAIFTDWLRMAVVVDNLTESMATTGYFREYTLGVKVTPVPFLSIHLDPHWNANSYWGFEAGAELNFWEYFFFRLGGFKAAEVSHLGLRGDGLGSGIGVIFPFFSVEYGFLITLSPLVSMAHNFGLSVHF